jgi:WD40 repeat protein
MKTSRGAVLALLSLWLAAIPLSAPAGARKDKAPTEAKKQPAWELRAHLKEQNGNQPALAFSPNGKTLAVVGLAEDGGAAVKLWDVSGDKPALRHSLAGHREGVVRLGFSRNGKGLVSVGSDGLVKRWDVAAGKALGSFSVARKGDDMGIEGAWLAGSVLAVRRPQGFTGFSQPLPLEAEFWSVPAGKRQRLLRLPTGHLAVALSPDGQTLVTAFTALGLGEGGGNVSQVRLWNVTTGRPARSCRTPEVIGALFSPAGKRVFLQCYNPATKKPGILFWDVAAPKPHAPRNPDLMIGFAEACSADGKRLATLSEDRHTVTVWDLGGAKRLSTFARLDKEIKGVALNATGKLLAVADEGGSVRIWAHRGP